MIPDIETKSTAEIKVFQETQLKLTLDYLSKNSPFYKRHFETHQLSISEIQTLEDLTKIPVTTKDDLQQFNDDFICVPKSKIIDYVTTSGTLGDPVTYVLTDADLERLAYNEAISFACAGVSSGDTLQLMTTMDRRFMAGLAYFLGVRKMGAGIIRVGAGIPELQWDSIIKFQPTYLIVVPSFLLKMIAYAQQHDINLDTSGIKGAICIGEAIRNEDFTLNTLGEKITEHWPIDLFSTYASTEMSTAFTECDAQQGGHLHPELIIAELLDEHNTPVKEGETGELTITTLAVEAMPLLRFKTGDMMKAHHAACQCGRNTLRLGPIAGRRKQMIKYKGTTLYPPAMENVLNNFNALESFVIEISHNAIGTDEILIKIASHSPSELLLGQIKDHFRAKLRVTPKLEWCDKKEIDALRFPKLSRKPMLVIDKRK
ncbi:phenylacetate--CoA ligase family protein [Gelidibacter salicanalis]|uniref:AMP-binding protein n=1 Tax=Gelidibacter salicanalis TaxID=291193 RepID=A0A934KSY4_9FLAO|nr:AMP-binding protein [Gelidibacter salicanalis]MBJ7879563.1 AMP-binding protein [Gelidibacter salicanalis]